MKIAPCVLACALFLASAHVAARVTQVTVTSVEPFAPGAEFGEGGAYERVKGVFRGVRSDEVARLFAPAVVGEAGR